MKITNQITAHPMFTNTDFLYLKKKGLNEAKIIEIWDFRLRCGKFPLIRRNNTSLKAI